MKNYNELIIETITSEINSKLLKNIIIDSCDYFSKILDKLDCCVRDKEDFLWNSLYDLTKAITNYLKSDDIITNYSIHLHSNTFTFSATITRNDKEYFFNCDSILAGGYNIQCLHIRYIVKTNLPTNTTKDVDLLKIKNIISKINKREKLLNDLEICKCRILKLENDIEKKSNYSVDDIIDNDGSGKMYRDINWSIIVSRGADKNYDYSEEQFNIKRKEVLDDVVSSFRKRVDFDKKRVIELKKEILKIENKINNL